MRSRLFAPTGAASALAIHLAREQVGMTVEPCLDAGVIVAECWN